MNYLKPTKLKIMVSLTPLELFFIMELFSFVEYYFVFFKFFEKIFEIIWYILWKMDELLWPLIKILGLEKPIEPHTIGGGPTTVGLIVEIVIYFIAIYLVYSFIQYLIDRKKRNEI